MALLRKDHILGVSAQITDSSQTVLASPADPYLIVRLNELPGLSAITGLPNHYAVFLARILGASNFFKTQSNLDDENNNVVVTRSWKALFDRNVDAGVVRKFGVRYSIDAYESDDTADDINPAKVF